MSLENAERPLALDAGRLQALLHLSSDWYWEKDAQHRFTFLSAGFASSGAKWHDYIGKRRWEIPDLEPVGGWEAHRATLDARLPYRDVLFMRTLEDGERRYFMASGEPIFDARGAFIGYRGTSRDVTAQRRAEELLRLEHALTRMLVEGEDVSETLKAVIRIVCEIGAWECGACMRHDLRSGLMHLYETWAIDDEAARRFIDSASALVFRSGEGLAGRVWESAQPLWSTDTATDSRSRYHHSVPGFGTPAAMFFPLLSGRDVVGVMAFFRRDHCAPEEHLLQAFAVVGTRIGQFLRRKENEAALLESRRRFETMAWHVPGMLFRLIERDGAATELLYVSEGAAAVVFDVTPAALQAEPHLFARMIVPEDRRRFEESRRRSASTGAVWNWEGRIRSRQGEEKWLNLRATPQRIGGDAVVWDGLVLNITLNKRAEQELRNSQRMLRELAAHRESAREEERARVAREVHDELGQALTVLRMELSMLAIAHGDAPGIAERVASLKSTVDGTIGMVRNVAAALRPASLDLGLVPAVEWLAGEFERRSSIACTLELPETEIRLEDAVAAVVFRILQESLTNVLRHAGAKHVEVEIAIEGGGLRLEVRDDGCGFDPLRAASAGSFGLLGMRERAMMLGGELAIDSAIGRGTRVRLFVPRGA